MVEYLVASLASQVSYLVHSLHFRSNSSPCQFDCGMHYGTSCRNTVVNKLVLHVPLYIIILTVYYTFIIIAMALFVVLLSLVSLLTDWPSFRST